MVSCSEKAGQEFALCEQARHLMHASGTGSNELDVENGVWNSLIPLDAALQFIAHFYLNYIVSPNFSSTFSIMQEG